MGFHSSKTQLYYEEAKILVQYPWIHVQTPGIFITTEQHALFPGGFCLFFTSAIVCLWLDCGLPR